MHKTCMEEESYNSNQKYERACGSNFKNIPELSSLLPFTVLLCLFGFIRCGAQKREELVGKGKPVGYSIAFFKLDHAVDCPKLHKMVL